MSWEFVLYSKEDGIGTITLNRPEAMNALGGSMRQEILEAMEAAAADREVRVIVTPDRVGEGFLRRGDVKEFVSGRPGPTLIFPGPAAHPGQDRPADSSDGKPVIAAVNGVAAGEDATWLCLRHAHRQRPGPIRRGLRAPGDSSRLGRNLVSP
jgi:2-(1,2-epoxy-1,2-dihydrophenyl)acetyl-CoA isomerase